MDISSVRFQPVPEMAQAEMTSTYGHPRLNRPETAKVNNIYILYICISITERRPKRSLGYFRQVCYGANTWAPALGGQGGHALTLEII